MKSKRSRSRSINYVERNLAQLSHCKEITGLSPYNFINREANYIPIRRLTERIGCALKFLWNTYAENKFINLDSIDKILSDLEVTEDTMTLQPFQAVVINWC